MTCVLTSFSSARDGISPRVTASPPQKGSTRRRSRLRSHRERRCGTCQRFPPAHFNGGRSGASVTRSTIVRRDRASFGCSMVWWFTRRTCARRQRKQAKEGSPAEACARRQRKQAKEGSPAEA